MSKLELQPYPGYDPSEVRDLYESRGWYTRVITPEEAKIIKADPGAAVECIDGRFGEREKKKLNGPKLPGQSSFIGALVTGADTIGLNAANKWLETQGYKGGTHKNCGFADLLLAGKLEKAVHPLVLPETTISQIGKLGRWIDLRMRHCGGKHFHIDGEHKEDAVIFNPYEDTTIEARPDRFGYDHWLMKRKLNGKGRQAKHLMAETVEKLKPDAMKIEIVAEKILRGLSRTKLTEMTILAPAKVLNRS